MYHDRYYPPVTNRSVFSSENNCVAPVNNISLTMCKIFSSEPLEFTPVANPPTEHGEATTTKGTCSKVGLRPSAEPLADIFRKLARREQMYHATNFGQFQRMVYDHRGNNEKTFPIPPPGGSLSKPKSGGYSLKDTLRWDSALYRETQAVSLFPFLSLYESQWPARDLATMLEFNKKVLELQEDSQTGLQCLTRRVNSNQVSFLVTSRSQPAFKLLNQHLNTASRLESLNMESQLESDGIEDAPMTPYLFQEMPPRYLQFTSGDAPDVIPSGDTAQNTIGLTNVAVHKSSRFVAKVFTLIVGFLCASLYHYCTVKSPEFVGNVKTELLALWLRSIKFEFYGLWIQVRETIPALCIFLVFAVAVHID
ncbi:hypothetical protein BJ138DRAFT_1106621 [Hygrophoropsis aurantiaca]|uniref:Uncharacterized protein n=1 Tax=Hygrophoropsis aurantiaca TaxID=72124 RepID=A0ACB7ZVB2_9AGAM|nr:hypothetical protein BJ138DRAFT_1106621 [Hygrophoropsis aurantiaca]